MQRPIKYFKSRRYLQVAEIPMNLIDRDTVENFARLSVKMKLIFLTAVFLRRYSLLLKLSFVDCQVMQNR